jgi:hypothetical protein
MKCFVGVIGVLLRASIFGDAAPAVPRDPLHGWRVQRQFAGVRREHHHSEPVLRGKRHLPKGLELTTVSCKYLSYSSYNSLSHPVHK